MQLSLWWTLVGAGFLISLTPGAGAVNTMANSLEAGWRRSLWGVLGQQAALLVHVVIVALGLGFLVATNHWLFLAIRLVGAAYLVWLGVRLWLARPDTAAPDAAEQAATEATEPGHLRPWAMFRRGLLVNLTNPKAIVFFLALTPQFIRLDRPMLQQYLVFGLTLVAIDIIVMWFFFAVAAKGLRRFIRDESGQRVLNRIFGTLFVAVGGLLAVIE